MKYRCCTIALSLISLTAIHDWSEPAAVTVHPALSPAAPGLTGALTTDPAGTGTTADPLAQRTPESHATPPETGEPGSLAGQIPGHGLRYRWDADGSMEFTADPERTMSGLPFPGAEESRVRLRLTGYGRGDAPGSECTPSGISGGEGILTAERTGLTEWYVPSAAGMEHGFTLHNRPPGEGAETVTLTLAADTLLRLSQAGPDQILFHDGDDRAVWTYQSLVVTDAMGNRLPAWLSLAESSVTEPAAVLLCYNDHEAQYPVEVDPTFSSVETAAFQNPSTTNVLSDSFTSFACLGNTVFFNASDGVYTYRVWKSNPDSGETAHVADQFDGFSGANPSNLTEFKDYVYYTAIGTASSRYLWRTDGTSEGSSLFFTFPGLVNPMPDRLTVAGDQMFFTVSSGTSFPITELWKTDGTVEGTVRAIGSGKTMPDLGNTVVSAGKMYFQRSTSQEGSELWISDGTEAGTHILKDINPGSANCSPHSFTAAGDKLFFIAQNTPRGRPELWVTDGTEAGTQRVGVDGLNVTYPMQVVGERILFKAGLADAPAALWVSDGTQEGTYTLMPALTGNTDVINLWTSTAETGYFFTRSAGQTSLWKTDGTPSGTMIAVEFGFLPSSSEWVGSGISAGGQLYFVRSDLTSGAELWVSDGTTEGTRLVADIVPGPGGSDPTPKAACGEYLYFLASDGVHGRELWRTDGTEAGTMMVRDIIPLPANKRPSGMTVSGGNVYFEAWDPEHGRELWKSDGTPEGTGLLVDLNPGPDSAFNGYQEHQWIAVGDLVYFMTDHNQRRSLWRTDGTVAGTFIVKVSVTGSSPSSGGLSVAAFGNYLMIPESSSAPDGGMWRTDGTVEGTIRLSSGNGPGITVMDGFCLYGGQTASGKVAIWRTDGTLENTFPITGDDLSPNADTMPVAGKNAFFMATHASYGREMWKTDGTVEGTAILRDFTPGTGSSNIGLKCAAGGRVFFGMTLNGQRGLWVTDGSVAGTVRLRSLGSSEYATCDPATGRFYYSGDEAGGSEPWVSDGTTAGSRRLADVNPGSASSYPERFTPVRGRMFFLAEAAATGREPWVSDGTPLGTKRLADINPGTSGSGVSIVGAARGYLFFAATDNSHGRELWVTDGTPEGTKLTEDLNPGLASSHPSWVGEVGSRLVAMYDQDPATGSFGLRELTVTSHPVLDSGLAAGVRAGSATLSGSLQPDDSTGSAWFEYGPAATYGQQTDSQEIRSPAGINATVVGLTPATTVHFRLVYQIDGGALSYGEDRTFRTQALRVFAGPDAAAPEISAGQTEPAFSVETPDSETVSRFITVQNAGMETVILSALELPGTFEVADLSLPVSLEPEASLTLEIRQFSRTAGVFAGNVSLTVMGDYPVFRFPVSVTVNFVNDPPVLSPVPELYTPEDTVVSGQLVAMDADYQQTLSYSVAGPVENATVTISPDGTFVVTPAPDFSGQVVFEVKVSDGIADSAPQTVTVHVLAVADPPVLAGLPVLSTPEDSGGISAALTGSSAEGRALTYSTLSLPDPVTGTLAFSPDGSFTFVPAPDFHGVASFQARASDGTLVSNIVLIVIAVSPVNDAPSVSAPATLTLVSGVPESGILLTATDPDTAWAVLRWSVESDSPALPGEAGIRLTGTSGSRSMELLPTSGRAGTLTLTVSVSDGELTTQHLIRVTILENRSGISRTLTGGMEVFFTGIPGRTYQIQRSTALESWTAVQSVTAPAGGEIRWTDPAPPASEAFYRLAR